MHWANHKVFYTEFNWTVEDIIKFAQTWLQKGIFTLFANQSLGLQPILTTIKGVSF